MVAGRYMNVAEIASTHPARSAIPALLCRA